MNVIAHPNPALGQRAEEIDPSADAGLRDLVTQMARLMYEAPGIGLAATQVGVMKRVIVYDISEDGTSPSVVCNPVIISRSEETEIDDEGCLSLPGITVPVERSLTITCEAQSIEGKNVTIEAEGLYARMLQHEIDHLDGLLILDRATDEERKAALRRYREAQEHGARPGQTSI